MPKWKCYLAEASPIAIGIVFLLVATVNPDISLPLAPNTWNAIVKEHFWRNIAFQRNIPKLLEQLSHKGLKTSTPHAYPVLPTVPDDVPRARIKTVINLQIYNHEKGRIEESRIEQTDWKTQLGVLQEHGGRLSVTYEMLEPPPPC